MREKTGYYDRNGKEIRGGDKIKGILGGRIYTGYTKKHNGIWFLWTQHIRISIGCLADREILEEK